MIRKSNRIAKGALLAAIGERVQAFQEATDEVDEAVARRLGLNRTDLRCLGVIARTGATSASALAEATGLTRGAMTTALDRLESAGWARRVWDQADRRSVRVELTGTAQEEIAQLYRPIAEEGFDLLKRYTADELAAALRYLEDGTRLQRAHAARIRQLAGSAAARASSARETRAPRGRGATRRPSRRDA